MRIYTYRLKGSEKEQIAVEFHKDSSKLIPVEQFGISCCDMTEFVKTMSAEKLAELKKKSESEGVVMIDKADTCPCAPISHPAQDIVCLGINYSEHAIESAKYKADAFGGPREVPIYFSKRCNAAVEDGGKIPAHADIVDSLDYESELAVIIGKDAVNVKPEDAFDYIFGYTIINDVSARTLQTSHKQWYFGKSLDGFTPMGPCIVTKDEFTVPPHLNIRSYVNGELRQNSNTALLLTDIPAIIAELTTGMTLKAGTIISTGTPKGVGMGFVPPKWLVPGDEVICEIEGIGRLRNQVTE